MGDHPSPRAGGTRVIAVSVFVAALAARLGHYVAFRRLPYDEQPFGDSLAYVNEAERIVRSGLFAKDLPYFQGPLYPIVLAAARAVGLDPSALYAVQIVTGALTAALVALLASRLHSRRAGVVAGFLYAFYDVAIFLDVDLLAASLVCTAVAGGLVLLTSTNPRPAALAGAGVLLGLAAWGQPNLALPLVVMGVAGGLAARRTFLPFVLAGGLVLGAPMARNLFIHGEPVLATSGGVNFFIGNHRGATGTFRVPPESGLANDLDLERISRQEASRAEGRALSPSESSRYWLRRGLGEIAADPGGAIRLLGRKLLLLTNHRDIANHLDLDFVRSRSPLLAWTPVRSWLILALGVAGLWLLRGRALQRPAFIFVLAGAASVLPFFITDRYRLPLMPALAAFGGAFVSEGLRMRAIAAGDRRRWLGASLFVVPALLLAMLPIAPAAPRAVTLVNLGALYAELGETDRARDAFRSALVDQPSDPRALENLALLELGDDRPAEALEWIERSLVVDARSFAAWNLRGVILGKLRRFDEAVESMERSLEIHPGGDDTRANLGVLWRDYVRHCQAVAESAGVRVPAPGEDPRPFAEFLEARGLHRAADRVREQADDHARRR
jgi:tetratricopeptide (TPR) repeat protein